MSKVYVLSADTISMDQLRKVFNKAKADARRKPAASNVEGENKDVSKPTA